MKGFSFKVMNNSVFARYYYVDKKTGLNREIKRSVLKHGLLEAQAKVIEQAKNVI